MAYLDCFWRFLRNKNYLVPTPERKPASQRSLDEAKRNPGEEKARFQVLPFILNTAGTEPRFSVV